MPEIRLVGVGKVWGPTRAVDDVTVTAPEGPMPRRLGPSGCGKSTTLRLLAGLERASAGRIRIGDRDVTDLPPAARRFSMVFRSYALFRIFSVRESIPFGLKMRHGPRDDRERRLARAVELLGRAIVAETAVTLIRAELHEGGNQRTMPTDRRRDPLPVRTRRDGQPGRRSIVVSASATIHAASS